MGLKDDDDPWMRPVPVESPTRPPRNHTLGLIALASAVATVVFELRLFTLGISPIQHEFPWLPPVLIVTIILCTAAGVRGPRAYGVVGGVLILLPLLYLVGLMVSASVSR